MNKIRFTLTSLVAVLLVLLAACTQTPAPAAPQAEEQPTLSAQASTATICVIGGTCHPSLQAAINAANAGDTIEMGAGIDTEAGIVITKNLTIQGQSASQSIVQAASSPSTATNRVFVVNGGVTVTLKDLTIRHGYIDGQGGGILNNGSLTLRRVTVSQNGTRDGRDNLNCNRNSCSVGNGSDGGGIYNNGGLTVLYSTISDNFTGRGGNLVRTAACTPDGFCDDRGRNGGDGGGVKNDTNRTLIMSNSTLSGNSAGAGGTCSGPGCERSGFGGSGGGLYAVLQFSHLNNVTITNNRSNDGGGINHDGRASASIVTLKNSLVVGNFNLSGQPSDCITSGGVGIVSEGYNLVGNGTGCPAGGTGDLTTSNVSSVLNTTLADNGGPTFTHALVANSAAINAGNPATPGSGGTACVLADQRAFVRPDRCDIGAFELGGTPDTTPPDTTITANPTNPSNSPDASFSFTGSDSGSGIEGFECYLDGTVWPNCDNPKVYSGLADGSHTFQVRAIDNANNKDASPASYTWEINTDTTAPVITPTVTGTLGNNEWYTSDVNVSWSVTDGESAVSSQTGCDAVTVSADTAGVTFTCEAASAGGTATQSVTLKRDATNPTIAFVSRTPANAAGWNNSDVVVTWNCTDATSGAVNASVNQTVSSEGSNQSSTGTCDDNAGLTASDTQAGINIDKTAPSLNPVVSPNPVVLNGSASVSSGANDSLSGLASESCGSLNTSSVGSKSVSCSATDNAGNTANASASYQVIYNFAGFFSPVDNLPTLNQVKAGQAIPVKFGLGGNQGLNILASGAPSSQGIACTGGTPDDIEQTVTAGSSSLSYDAATNTYSYVWKTNKSWAGTCRQLIVTLVDGTQHLANFKFK